MNHKRTPHLVNTQEDFEIVMAEEAAAFERKTGMTPAEFYKKHRNSERAAIAKAEGGC